MPTPEYGMQSQLTNCIWLACMMLNPDGIGTPWYWYPMVLVLMDWYSGGCSFMPMRLLAPGCCCGIWSCSFRNSLGLPGSSGDQDHCRVQQTAMSLRCRKSSTISISQV